MGKREAASTLGISLKNGTYDVLKWLVQVVIPAAATFYALLGGLWGYPNIVEVVTSMTGLALFLSTIMGLSKKAYERDPEKHDGQMVPDEGPEGQPIARLELNPNITGEALVNKKTLTIQGLSPRQAEYLRSGGLSEEDGPPSA